VVKPFVTMKRDWVSGKTLRGHYSFMHTVIE
jgi:hypothetical protein